MNIIEISDEQMNDLIHYYFRLENCSFETKEIKESTSLIPCSKEDIEYSLNEYHTKQKDESNISNFNIPILRFKSNNCRFGNYLQLFITSITENEPLKFNQCSLKTRTFVFFDELYQFN